MPRKGNPRGTRVGSCLPGTEFSEENSVHSPWLDPFQGASEGTKHWEATARSVTGAQRAPIVPSSSPRHSAGRDHPGTHRATIKQPAGERCVWLPGDQALLSSEPQREDVARQQPFRMPRYFCFLPPSGGRNHSLRHPPALRQGFTTCSTPACPGGHCLGMNLCQHSTSVDCNTSS